MPSSCTLCGTQLDLRDKVCKVCGTHVGAAAPESQRTEAGASNTAAGSPVSSEFFITPRAAQASALGWNRQGIAGKVCLGVAAAAVLGAACWGAFALWMRGAGGEIAFAQHNRAGNAAFERSDFNTADSEYNEMITLRPKRVDGYLLRAINDYKSNRIPQAIRDNTAALALTNVTMQRATLYFNRAMGYSNRRDWKNAIADYTAAEQAYKQASAEPGAYELDLQRMPAWLADARRGRARANLELKNYAQTIAEYSANINAGTISPEDYGMRGTAEEKLGRETEAATDYGKSILVDPGYMFGYQELNRLTERTHRYAQAARLYQNAAEQHPENILCWGSVGWSEHKAGNFPAAIAADERGLSLDPTQLWMRFNLGLSSAVAGDSARASKAYAVALAMHNLKDQAMALKDIQKALDEHPGNPALQAALKQVQAATPASALAASPAPTGASALPPAPAVDPAFEQRLAPDTNLHGYAIRPPAAYTYKQSEDASLSGNHTVDYWRGAARTDGTAPDLEVQVTNDDGRLAANTTPKQLMQNYLSGVMRNQTQFKASDMTPCTLGTQTFLKVTWSGIGVKTGRHFQGVVYIGSWTGTYVSIFAHDALPDVQTTLPMLDAAARTFRK